MESYRRVKRQTAERVQQSCHWDLRFLISSLMK